MLARPVPKTATATVLQPSIPRRQRRNSRHNMPLHPDSTAHHHPSITKPACSCVRANHRRRTPLQATDDSKRNATLPWTATGWPFGGLPIRCGLSYHRPAQSTQVPLCCPPSRRCAVPAYDFPVSPISSSLVISFIFLRADKVLGFYTFGYDTNQHSLEPLCVTARREIETKTYQTSTRQDTKERHNQ